MGFGKKLLAAGVVAAGAGVLAVAPRPGFDKRNHDVPEVPDVPYAHRGLHDAGSGLVAGYEAESGDYVDLARRMAVQAGYGSADFAGPIAPENSLASFAAAAEAGYGIELDLQLTVDGQVVVVHDSDLERVAGDPRRVADLTYEELTAIPLFPAPAKPGDAEAKPLDAAPATAPEGYYQHVPLFSDVLKVVDGRVPIIVEYKFDGFDWSDRDDELMEKGDALLSAYAGPYVIESFHPGAVNWYKQNRPEANRGQLADFASFGTDKKAVTEWMAGLLAFDWLSRPDFIAYDWHGGDTPQVRLARAMGATTVSWTVRSSAELGESEPYFDRFIFEAFVPRKA
ncbi:glycerophosphodiester phosphodiesterase family protein [Bifidobacterium avesanii]|uniref:Glycerophosphodiester phosphodiesterase n=1 Tax=Bifidobacterium avesanii TaxID=1798157 RepID=A0A7K3TJ13_9BIFI|nr:glycerophosphodiester phosphodiesterase family protein [Bifidobacterium avesanii]KAB8290948.1 glycerophosphodiester phosphodiesterase [Bifidobacterium avesanii]NEG78906.1 glycerophosphodiester phosphodiesterase [Bifidobacterium avesanii]